MPDNHNCLTCRFSVRWEQKNNVRVRCEALPEPFRFASFWAMEGDIFAISKMGCIEVKACPAWQTKEAQEGAGEDMQP